MINCMEIAKFLKESVEWLTEQQCGCGTYKLDERLAVCIGWSQGYDENDSCCIHAKDDPSYCITAGIKVWTSDSMRTDYDWLNFPYYENEEVWDTDISLSPSENYEELAKYFLEKYDSLKDFEIDKDGKIIEEVVI